MVGNSFSCTGVTIQLPQFMWFWPEPKFSIKTVFFCQRETSFLQRKSLIASFTSTNNLLASVPSGSQRNQAALVRKSPLTCPLVPRSLNPARELNKQHVASFCFYLTPFCSISLLPQNYRPAWTPLSVIIGRSWWRQCWIFVLAESK